MSRISGTVTPAYSDAMKKMAATVVTPAYSEAMKKMAATVVTPAYSEAMKKMALDFGQYGRLSEQLDQYLGQRTRMAAEFGRFTELGFLSGGHVGATSSWVIRPESALFSGVTSKLVANTLRGWAELARTAVGTLGIAATAAYLAAVEVRNAILTDPEPEPVVEHFIRRWLKLLPSRRAPRRSWPPCSSRTGWTQTRRA
jgi:hypothetical protein